VQRYRSTCRKCNADIARERGYDKTETRLAKARKWKAANPERVRAINSARRAMYANADHFPYSRTEIFARWSGCCYCDAPAEHLDHVTPISRQGADAEWNLVPACATCNTSKGAKTLAEWATTF
jgi:5-methylcytosine-specific restriction endonuclease McrA